jgi:hypothetical protein
MATYEQEIRSIIELHEKLNYDENEAIRPRVLDAYNRALRSLWSKADWTFRIQVAQMDYDPESDDNTLPENFLTFQHTGRVTVTAEDGTPRFGPLRYIPINEMMRLLRSTVSQQGNPEVYSVGGPISSGGNQRSIFIYPKPVGVVPLDLVFHAVAPQGVADKMDREIECIPPTWHFVVREIAILFRLMDKSADISAQSALVKTVLDGMLRDEPHGREDTPRIKPMYDWRMNLR